MGEQSKNRMRKGEQKWRIPPLVLFLFHSFVSFASIVYPLFYCFVLPFCSLILLSPFDCPVSFSFFTLLFFLFVISPFCSLLSSPILFSFCYPLWSHCCSLFAIFCPFFLNKNREQKENQRKNKWKEQNEGKEGDGKKRQKGRTVFFPLVLISSLPSSHFCYHFCSLILHHF